MTGSSQDVRCFESLKAYAYGDNDRNQPPYFAGRKHVLGDIEDLCENLWRLHRLPRPIGFSGQTRVIYGAPGAGKSSTLQHLRDEWNKGRYATRRRDKSERSEPVPVMMYSGAGKIFNDLEDFCRDLIKVAAPDNEFELHAAVSETVRKRGGAKSAGLEGGLEKEKTMEWYIAKASLKAVAELLPGHEWPRPVVVGVDEAQNMTDDEKHSVGDMLQSLHANEFNLPLVVVLAGLSNTRQRVGELGLSRLSRNCTHSLDCLNAAELEDLKRGFCGTFEIELGMHANWFDTLIGGTEGWPCHIQNALQAFARSYIEADGDMSRVDFDDVEVESDAARLDYYRSRRSPEMKNSVSLVGAVMQKVNGQQKSRQVVDIIEAVSQLHKGLYGKRNGLPRDMTAEDFYDHLTHRGALQECDDDTVICPIPSFRRFLIDEMLEYEQNRSDLDVLRHLALPDEVLPRDLPDEHSPYLH